MQAASALDRHAEAAGTALPPSQTDRRVLTGAQDAIVKEFVEKYDLRPEQIFFDGPSAQPYFDFEALSILVNRLSDIPSIVVELGEVDRNLGLVTAGCEITLRDGRTRVVLGSVMVGEQLPGGGRVADIKDALDVAQVRAFRKGLRAVGFDPVRAHEASKRGDTLALDLSVPRKQELAEAHIIGEKIGLIRGDDKTAWSRLLTIYFKKTSSADLDDAERARWLGILRQMEGADKSSLGTGAAGGTV